MLRAGKTIVLIGPAGSFSDYATEESVFIKKLTDGNFKKRYVVSVAAVFKRVRPGNYGLVPVRNKIIGKIPGAEKFFKKGKFKIIRRFRMPVKFVLAAKKRVKLREISRIFASPVARAQCKNFLHKNFQNVHFERAAFSTSASYKKVVQLKLERARKWAAIGSEFGAKIYQLTILAKNIQDDPHDWTEFVLFGIRQESSQ